MSEIELSDAEIAAEASELDEDDRLKPEFVREVTDNTQR